MRWKPHVRFGGRAGETGQPKRWTPRPGPIPLGDRRLDEVRRETWNDARRGGMKAHAKELKGARFALWRNPEDLTGRQEAKLAWIAQVNRRLYRAYLLKEQLRLILHVKDQRAIGMLQKCRYLGFVAGQTGDLGFCVEDMSSTECSAVEALGAEGSCELFSEGGVVGA